MTMTQKDFEAQEAQFTALKEEFSRLNQKFDAQLKDMGLSEADLKEPTPVTPEVEVLIAKAKEEAKRAGEGAGADGQGFFGPHARRRTPGCRQVVIFHLFSKEQSDDSGC